MSIGTGIVLLVVGAVLRFAINLPNPVIDLPTVGVILMGAGFVALAMGIFIALRPTSTVTTVVGDRAEALPPTKPYNRPSR
jgi:hypothetical protein